MCAAVMTLCSQQLISFEAALNVNVPGFTYGELLLGCTVKELAKKQPRAYVTPQNETDTLPVAHLKDANNNPGKVTNASQPTPSRKTQSRLDYKPEEVDLTEEVSEEVRELEVSKKRGR